MKLAKFTYSNVLAARKVLAEFTSYPYRLNPYKEEQITARLGKARLTDKSVGDEVERLRTARAGRGGMTRKRLEQERDAFAQQVPTPEAERAYLVNRGRERSWFYNPGGGGRKGVPVSPSREEVFTGSIDALQDPRNREVRGALAKVRMYQRYQNATPEQMAKLTPRERAKLESITPEQVALSKAILDNNQDAVMNVQKSYKNLSILNETAQDQYVTLPGLNTDKVGALRSGNYTPSRTAPIGVEYAIGTTPDVDFERSLLHRTDVRVNPNNPIEPVGSEPPTGLLRQLEGNEIARGGRAILPNGSTPRIDNIGNLPPSTNRNSTDPDIIETTAELIPSESTKQSSTSSATSSGNTTASSPNATVTTPSGTTVTVKQGGSSNAMTPQADLQLYKDKLSAKEEYEKRRRKENRNQQFIVGGALLGGGLALAGGSMAYDAYQRDQERKELEKIRQGL